MKTYIIPDVLEDVLHSGLLTYINICVTNLSHQLLNNTYINMSFLCFASYAI